MRRAGSRPPAAGGRRRRVARAATRRVRRSEGFTLLELVVVIAVIGVLAAAVTPAVMQQIMDTRISSTQEEARTLHEAMVGNHAQMRFGFVGDIGRLPASLAELVQRGSLPNYSTANTRGIGMGWRGPYVNSGTSPGDYASDAFGRPYTVNSGQVRSAGPDGVAGSADDIVYPPAAPGVSGTVSVTVKTVSGAKTIVDPFGYRVQLFYASDGSEQSVTSSLAPHNFTSVPMGVHAIRVVKFTNPNAGSVVSQDTIVVRPGSTTAVELWF